MADESREEYLSVDKRKIWYRMDGSGKPDIPLLILHGGPGFPHDYLTPLEPLSEDRPVIGYDLGGCGNSDKPMMPPCIHWITIPVNLQPSGSNSV